MFSREKRKLKTLNDRDKKPASMVSVVKPNSRVAEQFRTIRTNIQFSIAMKDLKTLLFSSSAPLEGKTTICTNVAAMFAEQGKKVVIVDADMRRPSIARVFHLKNDVGLSTLITEKYLKIDDVVHQIEMANLDVITSGLIPPNPSELLDSERMDEIIEMLKEKYDLIFFDLPPVVSVTDAQVLATKVDGVILVIRQEVAHVEDVYKAKELLELVDANILGAIFNGEANNGDYSNYYYYK